MPKSRAKTSKKQNQEPTEENGSCSTSEDAEVGYLDNPNIEEYMPREQTEWFHMVIQAQVKKAIKQYLDEQQNEFTSQLEQFKSSVKREIEKSHELCLKNMEDIAQRRTKNLEGEIKELREKEAREKVKLETELCKQQRFVDKLQVKIDSFEQRDYQSSVQVIGLPENENDTKAFIKMTKDKLGVKLKSSDVECTRMGKLNMSGKPRNLVVKFKDQSTRNEVYRHKKKLIMHKDPKRNVYINDKLTEHRQHVLYGARMCVKSHKLFAAWSQGGNILVRTTEKGKITQIHNHEDLRSLMDNIPSTMSRSDEDKSELLSHLSDYDFSYSSDI